MNGTFSIIHDNATMLMLTQIRQTVSVKLKIYETLSRIFHIGFEIFVFKKIFQTV